MIKDCYNTEKEQLKAIIYKNNIILNINSKLNSDLNVQTFIKDMVNNISNFDDLEHMKRYYFIDDFNELFGILTMFLEALRSDDRLKVIKSRHLSKPCETFPDNAGKDILRLIGLLPLMICFKEKMRYLDIIKDNPSNDRVLNKLIEYQEDKLFNNKSILYKRFPKKDDFMDHKLRSRHSKMISDDYKSSEEKRLNESINTLLSSYEENDTLTIGSYYWDECIDTSSVNSSKIKSAVESMSEAFKIESEDRLNKIICIINQEIGRYLEIKFSEREDSKKYDMVIGSILDDDDIEFLSGLFILRRDFEITNITLSHKDNDSVSFTCSVVC